MKKWLPVFLLIVLLLNNTCISLAEGNTTSALVEEVGQLIMQATPEERKEILTGLIFYMMLTDGESSLDMETDTSTLEEEPDIEEASIPAETYEYSVIFEEPAVEAYITGWNNDSYEDTIICTFDVTVYNNSDIDIEFGVKNLKLNGWNLASSGTYDSIARLAAGEKTRETWQLYGLNDKTDITSLNEIETIEGSFFIGKGDSWGEIIASQALTISSEDLVKLPFKN